MEKKSINYKLFSHGKGCSLCKFNTIINVITLLTNSQNKIALEIDAKCLDVPYDVYIYI